MKSISTIFSDFTSLVFPDCCYGCNQSLVSGEEVICTKCRIDIPKTKHAANVDNALKLRFQGRIDFKYAISYAKYTKSGVVGRLLRELKYHGIIEVGTLMGEWMGHEMLENEYANTFDAIIPVPLHKRKESKRGYNQATVFAESLAKVLEVDLLNDAVIRNKFTQSQTKFTGEARWENVKDIFQVMDPTSIENKRILLADDVVTTGATIEALANEILKYKPSELSLVTIADADH
jgi:ComF family protein